MTDDGRPIWWPRRPPRPAREAEPARAVLPGQLEDFEAMELGGGGEMLPPTPPTPFQPEQPFVIEPPDWETEGGLPLPATAPPMSALERMMADEAALAGEPEAGFIVGPAAGPSRPQLNLPPPDWREEEEAAARRRADRPLHRCEHCGAELPDR